MSRITIEDIDQVDEEMAQDKMADVFGGKSCTPGGCSRTSIPTFTPPTLTGPGTRVVSPVSPVSIGNSRRNRYVSRRPQYRPGRSARGFSTPTSRRSRRF